MPSMLDISTLEFLQLKKNSKACDFHNTEEEGGLPLPPRINKKSRCFFM